MSSHALLIIPHGEEKIDHCSEVMEFPQNFYTRKLGEISVFYAVYLIFLFFQRPWVLGVDDVIFRFVVY